jgi:osmotically inducible protein OsmC
MAEFSRKVEVNWEGGLQDGRGTAKAGSGAFNLPVSFPSRIGESGGQTSPEELIAAAHAACYAMALNATLGRSGGKAAKTNVTATITADKGEAGIKIVSSRLKVTVSGLQGIDAARFNEIARQAEQACPVSNALRNNLRIDLDASVAQTA